MNASDRPVSSRAEFRIKDPELFFAIVSPVGADSQRVSDALIRSLDRVDYRSHPFHLIQDLHEFDADWLRHDERNYHERYNSHMSMGNEFRRRTSSDDAFALLAATLVWRQRKKDARGSTKLEDLVNVGGRRAYIFRSFKRPEEVRTLRDIYGEDGVFVIATHGSREALLRRVAQDIAGSDYKWPPSRYREEAEQLILRDEHEVEEPHGQRLRDAFPLADLFVDASQPSEIDDSIDRFVQLLFDLSVTSPTRGEYAMFHAQAAAQRSASLSRQVGAAVTSAEGEVIAVGTNEVPKTGGGLYWEGDQPDIRDHRLGFDPGTETKKRGLGQIIRRLYEADLKQREARGERGDPNEQELDRLLRDLWAEGKEDEDPNRLRELWLSEETRRRIEEDPKGLGRLVGRAWDSIKGTELHGVLEFGRTVHAEMAALMDAALRGISVAGCTLYTTTWPCHMCARHIVAAGIKRVVYREPYPKSLAMDLHFDAIQEDPREVVSDEHVGFIPFMGVPPRRYIDLFTMGARRLEASLDTKQPKPKPTSRLHGYPRASSVFYELRAVELLRRRLSAAAIGEPAWLAEAVGPR